MISQAIGLRMLGAKARKKKKHRRFILAKKLRKGLICIELLASRLSLWLLGMTQFVH
jgi:hypothetical protein